MNATSADDAPLIGDVKSNVTFGEKSAMPTMLSTPLDSIDSALNTETASGTLCRFSACLRAVTTTSSRPIASWAGA
jgi:hypothetical protein